MKFTIAFLLLVQGVVVEPNCFAQQYDQLLFDEKHQPSDQLLQLLQLVGMGPLDESKSALVQMNDWAQKNLLRRGERWQEQTDKFEQLKPKLKPLLQELGFVNATYPHSKVYQGAIIHGASLETARLRLNYLVEQWQQGVRFSHLYFLSGERPLDTGRENVAAFISPRSHEKLPETECEMMQFLWNHSEIPEALRKQVHVYFINAPMQRDLNGNPLRPTTVDPVIYWLKESPPYGRYLAISNAPYTMRQDIVIKTVSPHEYCFDTVGPGANNQEKVAIFLDELARVLFLMQTGK